MDESLENIDKEGTDMLESPSNEIAVSINESNEIKSNLSFIVNLLSETEFLDLINQNSMMIIKNFKEYLKNADITDSSVLLYLMFHELNIFVGTAVIDCDKISLDDDKDKVN